ncbi:MAG TPA: hypothetical protein DCY79_07400 [Planctomycetaceae bacterium]|nr:hypothetical protein [Blastopirellula sp.]HAY79615.1 hypothetical protein [Planctomycetaceae bacterium]
MPFDSIHKLIEQFEAEWLAGSQPRVEAFIDRLPPDADPHEVLEQLLLLEIKLRKQAGEPIELADYERRFSPLPAALKKTLQQLIQSTAGGMKRGAHETNRMLDTQVLMGAAGTRLSIPKTLDRYELQHQLGKGSMGVVFRARDPQLERDVAIKVPCLSDGDRANVLSRFRAEARAVAAVQHPNICAIHEVSEDQGIPFIVMALIDGQSLYDILKDRESPLEIEQCFTWVEKIALAVREAHQQNIVHRDLKPSNIMINQRNEPVIMDFGLALRGNETTETEAVGAVVGTPAYMAPEYLRNKSASGPMCDIYSLGVILYELLSGKRPFTGDMFEMISQMVVSSPQPPSSVRPELSSEVDAICLQAICRDPEQRYESMGAFAEALTGYLQRLRSRLTASEIEEEKSDKETFDFSELSGHGMMVVAKSHLGIRLLDVTNDEQISEWTFAPGAEVSIGRATDQSVQIRDQRVSREHASIRHQDGVWKYTNQGRNGTYIEGKRLDQFDLMFGDSVQLGKRGPKLRFYPGE